MIPDPFGHPAGTGRPPEPATTPVGDRVITGARIRSTREWIAATEAHLRTFDTAGRILAVIGHLIADDAGWYQAADLQAALRDVDTVDLALDVLDAAGLGHVPPAVAS